MTDRPGYGSRRRPAGGFAANARAVLDDLDSRGIVRAVLVGHSYGGPRDTLVPVGTARHLARALPDARQQLVHDTGHHLPRRAPDAVADAIAAFLDATEEPARRAEMRNLAARGGVNIP